jgi:hypothetical protein
MGKIVLCALFSRSCVINGAYNKSKAGACTLDAEIMSSITVFGAVLSIY